MRAFLALLLALVIWAQAGWAVEPDEILPDPVLEDRAREISKDLRCLVCRNENIDSSDAGIAKDLRILVRERLVAGDSDEEVVDYVVDRYGEFVLLNPRATGLNLILWGAGPAMLLLGFCVFLISRRRPNPKPDNALSKEEEKRLSEIIGK